MDYSSIQTGYAKTATIKILVRRAKIVCSTQESLAHELNYASKIMQLNGCPASLVPITTKRKTTFGNKTEINKSFEKPKLFMPSGKGLSRPRKRIAHKYIFVE